LEHDPRYDAVGSSSLREELFLTHTRHLSSAPSSTSASSSTRLGPAESSSSTMAKGEKATTETESERRAREKKERAEASLREREEKVRAQQGKVQVDIGRSRGLAGKEEAEREFGSLLIDKVVEHDVRLFFFLHLLSTPRLSSFTPAGCTDVSSSPCP
jgi:transcription elongation regulator 1